MSTPSLRARRVTRRSIILVVLAVLAIGGLSLWWWSLKSADDPISADPVSAYGTIVTSQPCTARDASSSVSFSTPSGAVTATVHVCGYKANQSILVEYLRSDPSLARPAGSTPEQTPTLKRLLPIGILFAGVVAAAALLTLFRDRRTPRHARRRGVVVTTHASDDEPRSPQ
jgi:hypothetical protein